MLPDKGSENGGSGDLSDLNIALIVFGSDAVIEAIAGYGSLCFARVLMGNSNSLMRGPGFDCSICTYATGLHGRMSRCESH